jgi:hypothetical protein
VSTVLEKYRHIVVVNGEVPLFHLSNKLRGLPPDQQRQHLGGDNKVGWFYLIGDCEKSPNMVLESVVSPVGGDSVNSVYMGDPIFASIGELMRARNELIAALAEKIGLSVEAIGIEDVTRGRALSLSELATGQLIDMLAEADGSTLVTKDDRGGIVPAVVR